MSAADEEIEGEPGQEGEEEEVEEKSEEYFEEEEDPNEEPPRPDFKLEKKRIHDIIKAGLSQIGKTHNGAGYVFIDLNIQDKGLKTVFDILTTYPHLRSINISQNQIEELKTVNSIPYLLKLDASSNIVTSLKAFKDPATLTFLQVLNLSKNKITKFSAIQLPKLRSLNLNDNLIDSCEEFEGHPNLETLELRKNKLTSCNGLANMLSLSQLYLAENQITDFNGLKNLPALKRLHLRQNLIETFTQPLPDLPSIHHINLRENKIADFKELGKLLELTSLKSLNVIAQAVEEGGDIDKKEIIMLLPDLKVINKEEVAPEEREDALQELKERIAAEEERLREEAERQREEEERLREEEAERKREQEEEEERRRQEEQEELERTKNVQEENNENEENKENEEDEEGDEIE